MLRIDGWGEVEVKVKGEGKGDKLKKAKSGMLLAFIVAPKGFEPILFPFSTDCVANYTTGQF